MRYTILLLQFFPEELNTNSDPGVLNQTTCAFFEMLIHIYIDPSILQYRHSDGVLLSIDGEDDDE
jgi:hypothetical protein